MSNLHIFNLILLLQLLLVVHTQDGESAYDFQAFYKQFDRQYQGDEKAKRKAVFERNYQQLLDARAKSQGQFEVRVNNFTDMTEEEINNFFSYKPSQLNMPFDPLPSKNMLRAIALPQAFNYTAQGKVTPVKNQKKCGSCWAFATTAMYESQLLIKAIGEYDLSEQYVLQCTPQSSCNGGWPNTALHMFSDKGIPTQASNPYLADASPQNICSTQQLIKLPYQVEQIKHYNEVPDNELKQILLDNGPISVGVKGNGNGFLFYGGGVFTGCNQITESNQIDHVLLLVGWTKEGDWIVKNSWGKGWGDRGYAVISGKKNCGINKFVDVMKVGKTLIGQQNTNIDAIGTNEMQNLKVKLSDSFGDGWNGYVMGVRQDNSIITVFGEQFKSGSQQGPIDIQIKSGVQTQIVVAVAGKNSHQIGFSITDSEGKQVCSRNSGSPFVQTIIFCSFCPGCVSSDTVNFYYTLTGNGGWKGNVLAFKQNGMQTSFGEQFVGGDRYGPRKIQFIRNAQVEVLPYLIGSNTQQIGFQVRDSFGNLVLQRTPGTAFIKDTKLGNFCPGCENIFGINYDNTEYEDRSPYQIARHVDEKSLAPFIASIAVLSTMVIILGGVVVILALKNRKMTMSMKGSGQNLQKKQYIRQQSVPSENLSKSEVQKPETQASILPSQMDEINPVGSKAYIVSGTSTKYIN